jgi:DNA primase
VELPEGDDPDDYVQTHGGDPFAEYVEENRQDLPSFAYQRARRNGDLETPEDRVEAQREIIESVARIPDPNLRREYVTRTSEVVGVPDADLFRMLEEERERLERQAQRRRQREAKRRESTKKQEVAEPAGASASGGPPQSPPPAQKEGNESTSASEPDPISEPLPEERLLLRLMLDQGTRMVEHVLGHMALDEFTEGPSRKLVQALVDMYQNGDVQPERILDGQHGDPLQQLAAAVMMNQHEASENWAEQEDIPIPRPNDKPYEAAESAMKLLKLDRVNAAIDRLRERAYEATQAGEEEQMQKLQQKMMSLQKLRKTVQRGEFLEEE